MEQLLNSLEESTRSLLLSLKELDSLLQKAILIRQSEGRANGDIDQFRGLYISLPDVERDLDREAGTPVFASSLLISPPMAGSPLYALGQAFLLPPFAMSIIVIALAPEVDLRYERLYAFLQDDVTRKRPTVDLVLNLLCASASEKLRHRNHFEPGAPLLRHGILHLLPDPVSAAGPLLARHLKLDERVVQFLLGSQDMDSGLPDFCLLVAKPDPPEALPLSPAIKTALSNFEEQWREGVSGPVLYLRGGSRLQMCRAAEALAKGLQYAFLSADLSRCGESTSAFRQELSLVLRETKLQHAILYLENCDSANQSLLSEFVAEVNGPLILSSTRTECSFAPEDTSVITLDFPPLDVRERRDCWKRALSKYGAAAEDDTLDILSCRYRLTPDQIEQAVRQSFAGESSRHWTRPSAKPSELWPGPAPNELFAAARAQAGQALGAVAFKLPLKQTWSDLVLPASVVGQLREFCARVARVDQVLGDWGFDRKLSLGKGNAALFAGPSGTGKTMAAEVIARETKLDLYKVDLATVISKYIGETEKNLDRVFKAAENASAILFFDEADALFGKRSEVRDSHDRYANIEISYLLQKMEAYEGAAILATNLSQNIDESFARRFATTIRFPSPDEPARERIWTTIWPAETPLGRDINFRYLAAHFKLSGGNIKNAALAAAFLAAEDGGPVSMMHLLRAVEREFQKMGKSVSAERLARELQEVEEESGDRVIGCEGTTKNPRSTKGILEIVIQRDPRSSIINCLNETLRQLFLSRIADEIGDASQVSFELPDEEFRNQVKTQGKNVLNICLVELRENRNVSVADAAPGFSRDANTQRPARRWIDCHYLISAWSPATRNVEPTMDEHGLLSKAISALMESEPLQPAKIFGAKPLPRDFPAALRDGALPMILLPMERFPKIGEFWSTGRGHWKPTIHLVVTLPILMDGRTGPAPSSSEPGS
jgi:hypothetical protein